MGENSLITALLSSVGGGLLVWITTRVFTKSEDSASKEYVDAKCEKLAAKIEGKVSKEEFERMAKQIDTIYSFIINNMANQKK